MLEKIAIVGAAGAVGRQLLALFEERRAPLRELHLLGSESVGQAIVCAGKTYTVQPLERFDFRRADLVFMCVGADVSQAYSPRAVDAGAIVIDNSNAYRLTQGVPLVVPQVNGQLLEAVEAGAIIANPNCSTIPLVRYLKPILDGFGIEEVIACTYQAASGGGLKGIAELRQGCLGDHPDHPSEVFPRTLAYNVIPQVDRFQGDGYTLEEHKMLLESQKILANTFDLTSTAVRVPVINCHAESVLVKTRLPTSVNQIRHRLSLQPELVVYPQESYPTPREVDGTNDVHVGRLRSASGSDRRFWSWIVSDNLRVGAALNALQIYEMLLSR